MSVRSTVPSAGCDCSAAESPRRWLAGASPRSSESEQQLPGEGAGAPDPARIFSTGFILYGAINPDLAMIDSYADALSHVRRLKSLGAFSVKSYMQPRRE